MSAWIVLSDHIDVIVKSVKVYMPDVWEKIDPSACGKQLYIENWESVAVRYAHHPDGKRPGPIGFNREEAESYKYVDPGFDPTPGEALCAIECLNYQSCEHDGWASSDACKFIRQLAITIQEQQPPGPLPYEGPWGWSREDIELRQKGEPPQQGETF